MKKLTIMAVYFVIAFPLLACVDNDSAATSKANEQVMNTIQSENVEDDHTINEWYTGTLKFYSLEGGFFGLITENGKKLLPLNLASKYKKDGATIKVFGHIDNNIMTIQMWGSPFKVISAEIISEDKTKSANQTE